MFIQKGSPLYEGKLSKIRQEEIVAYLKKCGEISKALACEEPKIPVKGNELKIDLAKNNIYNALFGQILGGAYNID